MLQRNQIVLTIPTIDLSLLKRIKGGYSPDSYYDQYDNDNIYSQANYDPENDSYGLGELEPSVCKPNEPLDEFEYEDPEFPEQDEPDDYQNEDSRTNGLNDNGNSGPDGIISGLSKDTVVTNEILSQILAGTGIDYQFNQAWLDAKSKGGALGAVIYEGQLLPDGRVATHDTIILSDKATISTLNEELFHIWQGANCYNGDGFPTDHSTGPMELMAAVFDYIYDIRFGNGIYGDEADDKNMPDELWIELVKCVSLSGDEFDFNMFLEAWNDTLFDAWKDLYHGKGYGSGNLEDWEWNWEDAYDWWMSTWNR